ncbi:MAG TPA: hypothetical protein PKA59_00855 [Chakrabartia sp.]|jgi:hypothetical protein|nr:hypothetical protein [Chakrabartia sp.]
MSLPVSQAWEATLAYVKRESHLLVPLALATLALGQAAFELGAGLIERKVPPVQVLPLILPGLLLMLGGQLSILSLVFTPGISVGEALKSGFSRLPRLMLFSLGMGALFAALILPVLIMALKAGYDPTSARPVDLPGYAVVWAGAAMAIMIWLSIRTYFSAALMVDRNASVLDAVNGSFALTRGRAATLFGVAAIFMVVGTVLQSAAEMIVGILFGAIGKMAAMPLLPVVMVALGVGMVAAAIGLVTSVFVAMLYKSIAE